MTVEDQETDKGNKRPIKATPEGQEASGTAKLWKSLKI